MAVTKNETKKAEDQAEKLAPATEVAASGAVIEPAIAKGVDMEHPAVDANPRERSTAEMNQIDFNNPSALTPPEESVEENLADEGKK